MKTMVGLLALLVICPYGMAAAMDMSTLYPDATLASWQQIIPEDIRWNFEHDVKPVLSADERTKLAGVTLAFPLRGSRRDHHPGYQPPITMEEARHNEEEADRFALEIMRRIGVAPFGMTFFFTALAHLDPNRWDFDSEEEYQRYLAYHWTHPLTPQRLEILAHRLKEAAPHFARTEPDFDGALAGVHYAAGEIAKVAGFLADEGVQRGISHIGRTTDPTLLAPRRP